MLKRRTVVLAVAVVSGGISVAAPPIARALGPLSTFGSYGQGAGQMSNAGGIAIGPDGSAYLADTGNNRINVYSPVGVFVRSIGRKAVPTGGGGGDCPDSDESCQGDNGQGAAGVLSAPRDVAVDASGNVYVADDGNNRIDVFSPQGGFVRAFGKGVSLTGGDTCTEASGCQRGSGGSLPGTLSSPHGIGIDAAGLLYVAGSSFRVDVFSPQGALVRSIGKPVNPSGGGDDCETAEQCANGKEAESAGAMRSPSDVAIDAGGRVSVADPGNSRVDVFASDGAFIHAFGKGVSPSGGDVCTLVSGCRKGAESGLGGALSYPGAIAVAASGNLLVADTRNHRISEFTVGGAFVSAFGEGVASGAQAFQICTASACRAGISSTNPGSVSNPHGMAVDCWGTVYVVEAHTAPNSEQDEGGARLERVERIGEAGTELPPCLPSLPSTSALSAEAFPSPPRRAKGAKPTIEVELNNGSGTATLVVIVSEPGVLLLKGKGIRTVRRRAKRSGLYELQVVPKGKTNRKLLKAGKAKVKLLLTFKPQDGSASTQAKTVTLKRLAKF